MPTIETAVQAPGKGTHVAFTWPLLIARLLLVHLPGLMRNGHAGGYVVYAAACASRYTHAMRTAMHTAMHIAMHIAMQTTLQAVPTGRRSHNRLFTWKAPVLATTNCMCVVNIVPVRYAYACVADPCLA